MFYLDFCEIAKVDHLSIHGALYLACLCAQVYIAHAQQMRFCADVFVRGGGGGEGALVVMLLLSSDHIYEL